MIDLLFYTGLAVAQGRVLAHVLEVLRDLVHLLPFEVGNDDVDIVTAAIMHSAKKHEFGELLGTSARKNSGSGAGSEYVLTILKVTGIMVSRFMERWW